MYIPTAFNYKRYKSTIRVLSISILIFYLFAACKGKDKEYIDEPFDAETIPTLRTDSLTTLISDSGVIRYKVIAAEQLVFDKAADPRYYFPKGIYVEQFDTIFQIQATLKADTAWNYISRKLWRLKGNVFIKNIKNETFSTQEVFWDEREQRVYSNEYIEIKQPDKLMLKGFGFTSNQNMTQYRIFRPHDTNIYVEERNENVNNP